MQDNRLIHVARSGEGIVVLDLENDDYSCRYDPQTTPRSWCMTEPDGSAETGMVPHAVQRSPWHEAPHRDVPQISLRDIWCFARALGKASLRFRGRTVRDLTCMVDVMTRTSRPSPKAAEDVADIHRHLLSILPVRVDCLFNSFLLLHFLNQYGHRADWLFGVQLFPFRAHCWVASGSGLLNEVPHAIEDYEVIYRAGSADR